MFYVAVFMFYVYEYSSILIFRLSIYASFGDP
jgi:hypothetical protein